MIETANLQNISIDINYDSAYFYKNTLLAFYLSWEMDVKQREKKEKLRLQKQFGEHLRAYRKQKGLSPAELAKRCFMERSNIARIEMGRVNPSLFTLKKLADAMEVEVDQLLKGF